MKGSFINTSILSVSDNSKRTIVSPTMNMMSHLSVFMIVKYDFKYSCLLCCTRVWLSHVFMQFRMPFLFSYSFRLRWQLSISIDPNLGYPPFVSSYQRKLGRRNDLLHKAYTSPILFYVAHALHHLISF